MRRRAAVFLLLASALLDLVAAQDLSAVPASVRPDVVAAANAVNAQKALSEGLAQSTTPISSSGGSGVSTDGTTTTITPPVSTKKTFQQVDAWRLSQTGAPSRWPAARAPVCQPSSLAMV